MRYAIQPLAIAMLALTASLVAHSRGHAATVVTPAPTATVEGNSSDGGLFGQGGGGDFRSQTVISATEFLSFNEPVRILGMTFRPDASTQGGGVPNGWSSTPFSVNMLVRLSTTSAAVNGLSSAFADNIGADERTVLSGSVQVSSSNTLLANGTKAFDIQISFGNAFDYDPRMGNLLVDARVFSGNNRQGHTVDGTLIADDSASSIRTAFGNGGAAVASANDTYATIFRFTVSPVPEVSSLGLLALGLAIVALRARRLGASP